MISPQERPVYRQIAGLLRDYILAGRIRPGQLLPSETTLGQAHDVSRLTARAAINLLRAQGLAELRFGRGVVVREPIAVDDVTPPGGSSVRARMPSEEEAAELGMPEGVPILEVQLPDGSMESYPADRWRLRWPPS